MSDKLRAAISRLRQPELVQLDEYLHELLVADEPIPLPSGSTVVEERHEGGRTLRLERRRCGKPSCHCASGEGHGPYWYAYFHEAGRLRSRYIGKSLK